MKDSNNEGNPLTSTCDQCSLWVEAIYIVRPYKSEVLWGEEYGNMYGRDGGLIFAGGESCDTKLVVAVLNLLFL